MIFIQNILQFIEIEYFLRFSSSFNFLHIFLILEMSLFLTFADLPTFPYSILVFYFAVTCLLPCISGSISYIPLPNLFNRLRALRVLHCSCFIVSRRRRTPPFLLLCLWHPRSHVGLILADYWHSVPDPRRSQTIHHCSPCMLLNKLTTTDYKEVRKNCSLRGAGGNLPHVHMRNPFTRF